jgi:hypothetical protein
MKFARIIATAFGLASSLVYPRVAEACSGGPPCLADGYLPRRAMPANAPAMLWLRRNWVFSPAQSLLTLTDTSTGESVPLRIEGNESQRETLVRVDGELMAGHSYRVESTEPCSQVAAEKRLLGEFKVAPSAAFPMSLGSTVVTSNSTSALSVQTDSGSCYAPTIASQVVVSLTISEAAKPWQELFVYSTYVDGVAYANEIEPNSDSELEVGGSGLGRGRDVIFSSCSADDSRASRGVAPGKHDVQFVVTLPGSSMVLKSEPVTFELVCPSPELPDAGTPNSGGSGGASNAAGGEAAATVTASGAACSIGTAERSSPLTFAAVSALAIILARSRARSRRRAFESRHHAAR